MYQRQVLNYGQPKAAVIPRCWPVTNAHTHTHTHIYPRRGINPRDGRCFRGIISFGSGSWLTWTTVHSGRRLSAFRFPLFPPSPQTSCTPLFFYLTANFLPRFLSASLGAPFGKRVYMASLCERGGYSVFFLLFFFFSIKVQLV